MSVFNKEGDAKMLILTPNEIRFINNRIARENAIIKSKPLKSYSPKIDKVSDKIPLHYLHPHYDFYEHKKDVYCEKNYSIDEINAYYSNNNKPNYLTTNHEQTILKRWSDTDDIYDPTNAVKSHKLSYTLPDYENDETFYIVKE